jgi:hypothetical protein
MRGVLREWKIYAKAHKLKQREKAAAKNLHNRTLILKHWNQWLSFHYKLQDFTKRTRGFLSTRTYSALRPIFDAWKGWILQKKAYKLNKYTAIFFNDKHLKRKSFYGWASYISRKVFFWTYLLEI